MSDIDSVFGSTPKTKEKRGEIKIIPPTEPHHSANLRSGVDFDETDILVILENGTTIVVSGESLIIKGSQLSLSGSGQYKIGQKKVYIDVD